MMWWSPVTEGCRPLQRLKWILKESGCGVLGWINLQPNMLRSSQCMYIYVCSTKWTKLAQDFDVAD